jgi:hypothetical protein
MTVFRSDGVGRRIAYHRSVVRPKMMQRQLAEGKTVKNRLHLDASPIDGSTEDEVTRLLGLGATTTDVGQGSGRNWVVMADPNTSDYQF